MKTVYNLIKTNKWCIVKWALLEKLLGVERENDELTTKFAHFKGENMKNS